MSKKRLIVIAGPTAVGKSALATRLAQELGTEIVSADSRQIYRELTIGTARPSTADLALVPHHLVGFRSIEEEYDAGQYGRDALHVIQNLFEKYTQVILCGGSGLYIKAVCEGLDDIPEVEKGIREKIMAEYKEKGLGWLQEQVQETDPDFFDAVDRKNPHRLVRALELNQATGKNVAAFRQQKKAVHPFEILKIGFELERDDLFGRIDSRMDQMIASGLFEEAARFYEKKNLNALQTVGYQEIFDFLDGLYDRDEAIRLLKRNSRRYAKRQLTWFKKDKEIRWFRPDQVEEVVKLVVDF